MGYVYYNATASGRAAQLAAMGTALANAYAFLQAQPVLASSNAPATVGLTLYQNPSALKTFVDLNNFNVGANSPYAVTNTPAMEVDLACPAWLTNGLTALATIVSPDGPLSVGSLNLISNRVYLQLPPVTNYLSVILQPAPTLSVSVLAGMVIITWPVSDMGFVLQEASNWRRLHQLYGHGNGAGSPKRGSYHADG